jgi:hypothetical protein
MSMAFQVLSFAGFSARLSMLVRMSVFRRVREYPAKEAVMGQALSKTELESRVIRVVQTRLSRSGVTLSTVLSGNDKDGSNLDSENGEARFNLMLALEREFAAEGLRFGDQPGSVLAAMRSVSSIVNLVRARLTS